MNWRRLCMVDLVEYLCDHFKINSAIEKNVYLKKFCFFHIKHFIIIPFSMLLYIDSMESNHIYYTLRTNIMYVYIIFMTLKSFLLFICIAFIQ